MENHNDVEQFNSHPLSSEEKNWGMLCHLAVLIGFFVPVFGHILGPLIIWLWKRKQYPYVDYHGKEALNFQLTVVLASLVASLLSFLVVGFFLLGLIYLFSFIVTIIGMVKASQGIYFQYPFNLRLIN